MTPVAPVQLAFPTTTADDDYERIHWPQVVFRRTIDVHVTNGAL